jgi:hypothetical protein
MRSQVVCALAVLGFVVGCGAPPEDEGGDQTAQVAQAVRFGGGRQRAALSGSCGNTTCIAGFHCRTDLVFGAPVSACVPDAFQIQGACVCQPGFHSVQEQSGARTCAADVLPPPGPSSCATKTCEAGTHCVESTAFGAPIIACVADS